jgi:alkanesulfonate monooxygenase SsuD/methylene tetrahydromethanopterin reductase-like flavin-dependent oxidoreductase (luciferase family)
MGKDPSLAEKLKQALRRLLGRGEPEHPDDPYALVGAPKKPRPPVGSAAASVRPEDA